MADRYEPPSQQSTSDQRVVVRDTVENVVLARRRQQQVELKQFVRRLALLLSAVAVVVVAGSIAFSLSENTSVAYGFLWTLDIVTTLGSLPTPDDTGSRIILACLEILGIGTLFYGLATVAEFFVSGQLSAHPRPAPHGKDDRLLLRALHSLWLRPRRPPGRARPAAAHSTDRRGRSQPDASRGRHGRRRHLRRGPRLRRRRADPGRDRARRTL